MSSFVLSHFISHFAIARDFKGNYLLQKERLNGTPVFPFLMSVLLKTSVLDVT